MIEIVASRCAALADLATECASSAAFAREMERARLELASAIVDDEPILVCGNGGSAAQAAHFVGELVGRYRAERRPLRAVDLSACAPVVTCIGNDYSYEHIFSRQVQAWGRGVLVCLSTSGTSRNVLAAADVALSSGLRVVAITGECAGGLALLPLHAHVRVPTRDTALAQELTLSAVHSLCEAIDHGLTSGGW